MNQVTVKIDGREVKAEEGATILDVAERVGTYIPTLCHYPGLRPLAESKPDRAWNLWRSAGCSTSLATLSTATHASCNLPLTGAPSLVEAIRSCICS